MNWCDDTISWTYGLRANTLLDSSIKLESTADQSIHDTENNDGEIEEITSTNIRSLKNSKLDFDEVDKEKGKQLKIRNI